MVNWINKKPSAIISLSSLLVGLQFCPIAFRKNAVTWKVVEAKCGESLTLHYNSMLSYTLDPMIRLANELISILKKYLSRAHTFPALKTVERSNQAGELSVNSISKAHPGDISKRYSMIGDIKISRDIPDSGRLSMNLIHTNTHLTINSFEPIYHPIDLSKGRFVRLQDVSNSTEASPYCENNFMITIAKVRVDL